MAQRRRHSQQSGQALVESALTLPLVVFLAFGTIQLSLMLQARALAHYAAFIAVRTGSVNYADCDRMTHAAIAALIPAIRSFLGPSTPGSAGDKLAAEFGPRKNNKYSMARDQINGDVIWIYREQPLKTVVDSMPNSEDTDFDVPGRPPAPGSPSRLEVRLIFWYPLRIPFADWVMSRIFLAHFGLAAYTAQNPLLLTQKANWTSGTSYTPGADIATELYNRVYLMRQYVFPIEATYTMRMMTPVKKSKYLTQNCPPVLP